MINFITPDGFFGRLYPRVVIESRVNDEHVIPPMENPSHAAILETISNKLSIFTYLRIDADDVLSLG